MTTCCNDNGKMVPYSAFMYSTPSLPSFYWDVYSSEQRVKHICYEIDKIIAYASYLSELLGKNNEDIQEIRDYVNEFLTSGFDDALAEKIAKWIDDHLQFIFTHTIRQVYFGLTQDGHFVAYVPDSWSDIVFDTGADISRDTYGRLILRWDADSPYSVEQKPEYNDIEFKGLIAEIKAAAERAEAAAGSAEESAASAAESAKGVRLVTSVTDGNLEISIA